MEDGKGNWGENKNYLKDREGEEERDREIERGEREREKKKGGGGGRHTLGQNGKRRGVRNRKIGSLIDWALMMPMTNNWQIFSNPWCHLCTLRLRTHNRKKKSMTHHNESFNTLM